MLLAARAIQDNDIATGCILHTWYSAFSRTSHMTPLQVHIRPLFDQVLERNGGQGERGSAGGGKVFWSPAAPPGAA